MTPSATLAAAAVPRVEARAACTVVTVTAVVGGMSMVAVMTTLPGATRIVTRKASTWLGFGFGVWVWVRVRVRVRVRLESGLGYG